MPKEKVWVGLGGTEYREALRPGLVGYAAQKCIAIEGSWAWKHDRRYGGPTGDPAAMAMAMASPTRRFETSYFVALSMRIMAPTVAG